MFSFGEPPSPTRIQFIDVSNCLVYKYYLCWFKGRWVVALVWKNSLRNMTDLGDCITECMPCVWCSEFITG